MDTEIRIIYQNGRPLPVRVIRDGVLIGEFRECIIENGIRELEPKDGFACREYDGNISFHFKK